MGIKQVALWSTWHLNKAIQNDFIFWFIEIVIKSVLVTVIIYTKKHSTIDSGLQEDVVINGFLLAAFLVTAICMELEPFPDIGKWQIFPQFSYSITISTLLCWASETQLYISSISIMKEGLSRPRGWQKRPQTDRVKPQGEVEAKQGQAGSDFPAWSPMAQLHWQQRNCTGVTRAGKYLGQSLVAQTTIIQDSRRFSKCYNYLLSEFQRLFGFPSLPMEKLRKH